VGTWVVYLQGFSGRTVDQIALPDCPSYDRQSCTTMLLQLVPQLSTDGPLVKSNLTLVQLTCGFPQKRSSERSGSS